MSAWHSLKRWVTIRGTFAKQRKGIVLTFHARWLASSKLIWRRTKCHFNIYFLALISSWTKLNASDPLDFPTKEKSVFWVSGGCLKETAEPVLKDEVWAVGWENFVRLPAAGFDSAMPFLEGVTRGSEHKREFESLEDCNGPWIKPARPGKVGLEVFTLGRSAGAAEITLADDIAAALHRGSNKSVTRWSGSSFRRPSTELVLPPVDDKPNKLSKSDLEFFSDFIKGLTFSGEHFSLPRLSPLKPSICCCTPWAVCGDLTPLEFVELFSCCQRKSRRKIVTSRKVQMACIPSRFVTSGAHERGCSRERMRRGKSPVQSPLSRAPH